MRDNTLNILIGGEAGQGLVTVGQLLAKSLARSGYSILITQSYQSRIRGGHNTFAIRAGIEKIIAPREPVDLLVALDSDTVTLHRGNLSSDGIIVLDIALDTDSGFLLKVPFKELAQNRFSNIVALGVVGSIVGLSESLMAGALDDFLDKKDASLAVENQRVLASAVRWTAEHAKFGPKLPTIPNTSRRLMMNGNEAIALGALSAGLKFAAFYPMTPATSINLNLAGHAKKMGLIVEQAEWTGNYMDNHVKESINWSKKTHNVEFINLSKKEKAKWDKKLQFLNDKWVAGAKEKGLPAKKIVKDIKKLVSKYSK